MPPHPKDGKDALREEILALVSRYDAALDCWLTAGRFANAFERDFARWIGVRGCAHR